MQVLCTVDKGYNRSYGLWLKRFRLKLVLATALAKPRITREYEAIAIGKMTAGGVVEGISRHTAKRTLMDVNGG